MGFVTELCDPRAGDLRSRCLRVSMNGEDGGVGGCEGHRHAAASDRGGSGATGSLGLLGTRDL